MRGMMNMMGEMNKMMENCIRMMQTRNDRQNTGPRKKDGRGKHRPHSAINEAGGRQDFGPPLGA